MKIRIILTIILLTYTSALHAQSGEDDLYLDSIAKIYSQLSDNDTSKLSAAFQLMRENYNADSVQKYAEATRELAHRFHRADMEIFALHDLAWVSTSNAEYTNAIKYNFDAILICDSIGDLSGKAMSYYQIGCNYGNIKDHEKADNYFHEALKIHIANNDSIGMARTYRVLAQNYRDINLYEEAEKYLKKAFIIDSTLGKSTGSDYAQLGSLYNDKFDYMTYNEPDLHLLAKSKDYHLKGMTSAKNINDLLEEYECVLGITRTMINELDYQKMTAKENSDKIDSVKFFINRAYDIIEATEEEYLKLDIDLQRIFLYSILKDFGKGEHIIDSLLTVCNSDMETYRQDYINTVEACINFYEKKGDFANMSKYQAIIISQLTHDDQYNLAIKASQNMAQHEFDEKIKMRESAELKKEIEYQNRTKILIIVIISIIIVLGLIIRMVVKGRRHNIQLNKKNIILNEQKEELLQQKEEINAQREELISQNSIISIQNKNIGDSIAYASLIQKAALPTDNQMEELFSDYFVIYRPLNIVAGDFYWANRIGGQTILAVADCTGHGVPGAFVSMLGISLLNEITNSAENISANGILNAMRRKLKIALHQTGKIDENKDGMDIAIIIVDQLKQKIRFAGANRPLIMARNNEITKIPGDRMPIGAYIIENDFEEKTIEIQKGDAFYMLSDGITDQFGRDNNNSVAKYGYRRLNSLLLTHYMENMTTQKTMIEKELDSWKSDQPQLDDNIMIGIKI